MVKLHVTCGDFQRCVWGTFPNVASRSVLFQKITSHDLNLQKNLQYSPHRKSGDGSKQDVSIILKTRPIQLKTSFRGLSLAQRGYRDVIGHPRCPFALEGRSKQMWQSYLSEVAPPRGRGLSLQWGWSLLFYFVYSHLVLNLNRTFFKISVFQIIFSLHEI